MQTQTVLDAADAVFAARRDRRAIEPIGARFGLSGADDGYAVQTINTQRWREAGRVVSGHKIGLTSKAVQAQLGVGEPDFGLLWADTALVSGSTTPVGHYIAPRIEAEVAFVIKRRLDNPFLGLTDLIGAIDHVLPALEIVDSAIADWKIQLVDTIADNASGASYVLGTTPRLLAGLDLRLCGMVMTGNGRDVSVGAGAACLGNPLLATLWLARTMAARGEPLDAGGLVLSGALGPMVPARAGDVFRAEIGGLGSVDVEFGA